MAGPVIWNWLVSDSLRDPAISRDSFKRSLKTFFVFRLPVYIAHQSFLGDALYKFTYLLAQLLTTNPQTTASVCLQIRDVSTTTVAFFELKTVR